MRAAAAQRSRVAAGGLAAGGLAAGGLDVGGLDVVGVMRRFSATAMVAVTVIAATGVVQTVRLHDDLGALTSGQHGRLLGVKVAAFVGMLAVAVGNRQRVARLVGDGGGRRDAAGLGVAAGDGGAAATRLVSVARPAMVARPVSVARPAMVAMPSRSPPCADRCSSTSSSGSP